jgi:hypothetical protein
MRICPKVDYKSAKFMRVLKASIFIIRYICVTYIVEGVVGAT